jgi:hypothetical protein
MEIRKTEESISESKPQVFIYIHLFHYAYHHAVHLSISFL